MNYIRCSTRANQKKYIAFIKAHYKDDPYYVDYTTPIIKEIFLNKSPFAKSLWWESFLIEHGGQLVGVVTYLIHKNYSNVLQIAFFEYEHSIDYAADIVAKARLLCKEKATSEIVVGLNGHVNYGLGLSFEQSHRPTFGSAYTKVYYAEHFKELGFDETRLISFEYPWQEKAFPLVDKWRKRFHDRYHFRVMTKDTYAQDLMHYTDLNNRCFGTHPFYFSRTAEEDQSLFKDLKFFLEKGSLIFVESEGKPIGFLLWYPDWGELMSRGETLSAKTFIKKLLFRKKVKCFKLVEWAVLPEFRQLGIPVGLLAHCFSQVVDKNYTQCKTSWIIEDNANSSGFGFKWANPYETFGVYSLKIS